MCLRTIEGQIFGTTTYYGSLDSREKAFKEVIESGAHLTAHTAKNLDVRIEGEEVWGEAVEGVQVRLRVDKAVWESGKVPTFHADVRNNGEREIVMPISGHGWGLEFDGEWYESRARPTVGLRKLPPGEEYCGVKISLGSWWLRTKNLRERIQLKPGKHTVRVG